MHSAAFQHKQRGLAMLLVLMITAVIAVVVTVYQYKNKAMLTLASQAKDHMTARARLESAKEELLFKLTTTNLWLQGPSTKLNSQLALPAELNFRGKEFQWNDVNITLTDATGLISVTPFNRSAWLNLLRYQNIPNPESLLAALEDWYDTDDFVRINGAERQDYAQGGLPRNDTPQSLSELMHVKNLAPYWPKLSPYITFLGYDLVNYHYAPNALLPILLGEYRAQQVLEQRQRDEQSIDGQSTDSSLMIEQNEDMNVSPSTRLRVTLSTEHGHAAYRESFVLLRARYNKRLSYIAEKQTGYILPGLIQSGTAQFENAQSTQPPLEAN